MQLPLATALDFSLHRERERERCALQVGYEGLVSNVLGATRPQRGPSRMSKSSKAGDETDNEMAKERLLKAVGRAG